ncbi:MAG: hypothetical protein ACI9SC_000642 [Gammaproteobacteria bacterium]|jgi:hypothetical protein
MYEFDDDVPHQKDTQRNDNATPAEKPLLKAWPEAFVRLIGIVLLLVGLWASIQVLLEALRLYRDPIKVEVLASAIERGSNLDKSLTHSFPDEATIDDVDETSPALNGQQTSQGVRLTYFVAWIIALLILLLVAMIALSFIRTGSELVLQDKQIKRYIHLLNQQGRKLKAPDK